MHNSTLQTEKWTRNLHFPLLHPSCGAHPSRCHGGIDIDQETTKFIAPKVCDWGWASPGHNQAEISALTHFIYFKFIPQCSPVKVSWMSQNWLKSNRNLCSTSLGPRNGFPGPLMSTNTLCWCQNNPRGSEVLHWGYWVVMVATRVNYQDEVTNKQTHHGHIACDMPRVHTHIYSTTTTPFCAWFPHLRHWHRWISKL